MLIQIAVSILIVLLVQWAESRVWFLTSLSPVIACYALGILLANLPFFNIDNALALQITEISVVLAIPLLLFSSNVWKWVVKAPGILIGYGLFALSGLVATICLTLIQFFTPEESWKIGGMVAGLFTGGMPNLQAIGMALQSSEESIIMMNTADLFVGGLFFFFLLSLAPTLLGYFFKSYQASETNAFQAIEKSPFSFRDALYATTWAIGIVLLTLGITQLIFSNTEESTFIILMVTSLGILFSFSQSIHNLSSNYEASMFFLLLFSFSLGLLSDFTTIVASGLQYIQYLGLLLIIMLIIFLPISYLLGYDRDTVIMIITAGWYGPAFVGPIAKVLKNDEAIFTGIICGLIGLSIGNYFGISVAFMLQWLLEIIG